jgi:hypothetical protein
MANADPESQVVPVAGPMPLTWRAAAWVATALAGLALALAVAHWGWRLLGPASAPLAPPETPEHWASSIASAPLFGRAEAPLPVAAAAPLQGDARLLGVFAERNGQGYALFRLPDRGPLLVQAGQEIAKDVSLLAVRNDGVRIRDHGEVREIALRNQASAPSAKSAERARGTVARAVCVAPAGYKGPIYKLNAELLTGIASQTDSWKALLVADNGGLAIRDNSGFSTMLGMRAGDRMTQANGIALGSPDDLLVAFVKPLVSNQQVRVAGTREGKPAEWLFVNAGACPG